MRMSKLLAAVAVSSLIATPALANSAAPLSISKVSSVKVSTTSKKSNEFTPALLLGLLGIAGVIGGVVAATSSDSP